MTPLSTLVERFLTQERPVGTVLAAPVVQAQAVAATRLYAGYAELMAHVDVESPPEISLDTELSDSEWALIRPLFLLYVEREQAVYLEASRGFGLEGFGRASSEIAGDITQMEMDFSRRAFCRPVITI